MGNNILTKSEIKNRSKRIFQYNEFVEKAFLFGSYARENATVNSDIDFMVVLNRNVGLEFFGLYDSLQEEFNKQVDVITEEEAYRIMPKSIAKEGYLIYERKNTANV